MKLIKLDEHSKRRKEERENNLEEEMKENTLDNKWHLRDISCTGFD